MAHLCWTPINTIRSLRLLRILRLLRSLRLVRSLRLLRLISGLRILDDLSDLGDLSDLSNLSHLGDISNLSDLVVFTSVHLCSVFSSRMTPCFMLGLFLVNDFLETLAEVQHCLVLNICVQLIKRFVKFYIRPLTVFSYFRITTQSNHFCFGLNQHRPNCSVIRFFSKCFYLPTTNICRFSHVFNFYSTCTSL